MRQAKATDVQDPLHEALGAKVRTARERHGLLLKDLAAACGVTASLLSQVERGLANPSLNTLRAIAQALEVPLVTFFEDTPSVGHVVHRDQRRHLTLPGAVAEYELVSPRAAHHLEVGIMELKPGKWSVGDPLGHRGEEVSWIVDGVFDLETDTQVIRLLEGDSVLIPEWTPHRWMNAGSVLGRVGFAISPPGF